MLAVFLPGKENEVDNVNSDHQKRYNTKVRANTIRGRAGRRLLGSAQS
jgi:hypothetical protein